MPGISVGDGAVIGSRAVITKDVEPYAIVAGNPAKVIRMRFPEEQVQLLLEMRWWDWPMPAIEGAMPLLCSGDIWKLYSYWNSLRE